MSAPTPPVPRWIDIGLIPFLNIILAFFVSGLVILAVGENPFDAVGFIILGAFGYDEGIGYTLFYTTNFIFTGLAVALAFRASLFNIGGEGQAYLGGLGLALVVLSLDLTMPFWIVIPPLPRPQLARGFDPPKHDKFAPHRD